MALSVAAATCQILPPHFPGYLPYCPYTAHASKGGLWTAPDLAKARALVARSGTRGMKITVFSWGDLAGVGRYAVKLLRSLGYRVSMKTPANYFEVAFDSRSKAQVGTAEWITDYPTAAGFFSAVFTCASFQPRSPNNENGSEFCDPRLDREIGHAVAEETTNPDAARRLWAQIDRRTVDEAPWVPLVNPKVVDVVSKRVGNYQYSPAGGARSSTSSGYVDTPFASPETAHPRTEKRRRLACASVLTPALAVERAGQRLAGERVAPDRAARAVPLQARDAREDVVRLVGVLDRQHRAAPVGAVLAGRRRTGAGDPADVESEVVRLVRVVCPEDDGADVDADVLRSRHAVPVGEDETSCRRSESGPLRARRRCGPSTPFSLRTPALQAVDRAAACTSQHHSPATAKQPISTATVTKAARSGVPGP